MTAGPTTDVAARLRAAGCVFAEDESRLLLEAAPTPQMLEAMIEQRVRGVPLEHIIGWAEFCGLRISLNPGVFVPRRRTELLVREAVRVTEPGSIVVDLCCGSGAVAAALNAAVADLELYAVDIDPAAVRCARANLPETVTLLEGDLDRPLPGTVHHRVDVLIANAPYVPVDEIALMPREARLHEPRVALDGGEDGVAVHRRIAALAPRWLRPAGALLIETSPRQAPHTATAMADNGFVTRVVHDEEISATVVIGTAARRPSAAGVEAIA
jgi:release factor glutamine methyltransferase